jgi:hypothetical protein
MFRIRIEILAGAFTLLGVACGGSNTTEFTGASGLAGGGGVGGSGGAGGAGALATGGSSATSGGAGANVGGAGATGSGGASGASGASGATGSSGASGASGSGGASGASGTAGGSGLGAWGGGGGTPGGCTSFAVQVPNPCVVGIPCPCGGSGTVACGDGLCPWKTTCTLTSTASLCDCPAGTTPVGCLDGKQCNGASCAAERWGCQALGATEVNPGCTGTLSKVSGTCHCQDGRTLSVQCGTDATCDALCLGAPATPIVPGTSPRGSGAPVGGACSQTGALVCGTSANCAADNLILQCQNNVYVQVSQCQQTQTCTNLKGLTSVGCYAGTVRLAYAIEATACTAEQATMQAVACTFDQSKVVACKAGTWQVDQTCTASLRCDHFNAGEGLCPATAAGGCIGCK